jgi:YD repeat-containing protein
LITYGHRPRFTFAGRAAGGGRLDDTKRPPVAVRGAPRRGRITSITNTLGGNSWTTSESYNDANQLLTESYLGGSLNGLSVNSTYNGYLQRDTVNIKNGATQLQGATYGYDLAGRLQSVTDSPYSAIYTYQPNSALIQNLAFTNASAVGTVTSRTYDRLNRLLAISSKAYGTSATNLPSSYSYLYNAANQRTRLTLGDGSYWVYRYDPLGQVTSGKRYWGDGAPMAGQQFQYGFDDIVKGSVLRIDK